MWDSEFARNVITRRYGYKSQFCKLTFEAVERGFFIDQNGEKCFVWEDHNRVLAAAKHKASDTRCALHLAKIDTKMRDEVLRFGLNLDLVKHIFCDSWNAT